MSNTLLWWLPKIINDLKKTLLTKSKKDSDLTDLGEISSSSWFWFSSASHYLENAALS